MCKPDPSPGTSCVIFSSSATTHTYSMNSKLAHLTLLLHVFHSWWPFSECNSKFWRQRTILQHTYSQRVSSSKTCFDTIYSFLLSCWIKGWKIATIMSHFFTFLNSEMGWRAYSHVLCCQAPKKVVKTPLEVFWWNS